MKYIVVLFLTVVLASCVNSQNKSQYANQDTRDSLLIEIDKHAKNISKRLDREERFKIYKTDNLYNLLELDTWTGKIWQIQWTLDDDTKKYEFTSVINDEDLSNPNAKGHNFELQRTDNMYQFLLLDKVEGRVWHVQWGLDDEHRWIRIIP